MANLPGSAVVANALKATYMAGTCDAVVALTDAFCRDHLDGDYRSLAQAMAAAACRLRPSPLAIGQPRSWACAIIYALGQRNFLPDTATTPHMAMAEVCAAFGVGRSSASAKARTLSRALRTPSMDPTWMLPSLAARNALVWMAKVDGALVDLRGMPREAQVLAYRKGIIPYVPADQGPRPLSQEP